MTAIVQGQGPRERALELAQSAFNETPDEVVARATAYLAFLTGTSVAAEKADEPVEVKATRTPRKAKVEEPTPEPEPEVIKSSYEPGDDLLGEELPQPDVSDVNEAVLKACGPAGIGKAKVIELLAANGSSGGVPSLPKENYRAFLNALESANG